MIGLDTCDLRNLDILTSLTALESAYVGWNRISDLSPLGGKTELYRLVLRDNDITDLSGLVDLPKLRWLDLQNNSISDISPLMELNATHIDLLGNPLNADAYNVYIPMLLARDPYLQLTYDPAPEPTGLVFLATGCCVVLTRRRSLGA